LVKSCKAPQLWVKKNRQFAAALAAAQLAAEPWGLLRESGDTNWVPPLAKGKSSNIIELSAGFSGLGVILQPVKGSGILTNLLHF